MCLIGDSIPIVNRLALLTMRCQLSNVRITCEMLFNIHVNVIKLLNCSCVSLVVDMSMHLKKLLITDRSINDVTS